MLRASLVLTLLVALMAARVAHRPPMTSRAPRGRGATVVAWAWPAEPAVAVRTHQER